MTTSTVSVTVPAEHAAAVRDGVATVLATLNLATDTLGYSANEEPATPADVVAEARRALTEQGIDPETVARLVFGTEEWDNGYFYSDYPGVEFRSPTANTPASVQSLELPDIARALYDMRGETLGRYAQAAVIDLVAGTVET